MALTSGNSCIEVEPLGGAKASVILLHGGGGDNREFLDLLENFAPPGGCTRFILPNAPRRRLTLFGGAVMRAWYDVVHADLQQDEDEAGVCRSGRRLQNLIERERRRGIPSNRIVVGGFSQGGAMALYVGARYPEPLAGLIALSAYLPLMQGEGVHCPSGCHQHPPVYIGHGQEDDLVPIDLARQGASRLAHAGHCVRFTAFDMGHEICPRELVSVKSWLEKVLP